MLTSIKKDFNKSNDLYRSFLLFTNYPNPFNSETNLSFSIDKESNVRLILFNSIGEKIKTISRFKANPGLNKVKLKIDETGRVLPSGIYYVKIESNTFSATQKMVYLK